jgi:integrase
MPLTALLGTFPILALMSVEPKTSARYCKAVVAFGVWFAGSALVAGDAGDLDIAVAAYLDFWYLSGGGVSHASNVVSGIVFVAPWLSGKLPLSARCIKGIHRLLPSRSWPPMTWDLAVAVAICIAGDTSLTSDERDCGLAVLVHFEALLRTGELLALKVSDVLLEDDLRRGGEAVGCVLRLSRTKTGPNKVASLDRKDVVSLLADFAKDRPAEDRLFRVSPRKYREVFARACKILGLVDHYVPHSLRHGQATRLSTLITMETLMIRGRWASRRSLTTYVQRGRSLLAKSRVPFPILRVASSLAANFFVAYSLARS